MSKHFITSINMLKASIMASFEKKRKAGLLLLGLLVLPCLTSNAQTTIGGVNMGNLTNYLFFFADDSTDANWQGATKGFAGNVAIDGVQAKERTSGGVPFSGTIFTNDNSLGAWANIVDQNDPGQVNPAQAFGVTGQNALISGLEANLNNAFSQINALPASTGFTSVSSTSLNGLNRQNGIAETKLSFLDLVDYSIFPNPAGSFAKLNLEKLVGEQNASIVVFTKLGQEVKRIELEEVWGKFYQMDIRDLKEDHYILWLNVPGKQPVAKKLAIGKV
jgi:hypothetical protein